MTDPASRENPFERFDLDPTEGPDAITRRLREHFEEAEEPERTEIRAVWEELTMNPLTRLRAALTAYPATSPAPVDRSSMRAARSSIVERTTEPISFGDIAPRPLLAPLLGLDTGVPPALPSIHDDPLLRNPSSCS